MYNGIGLTTPRGSGTNGHIQSNKFFVRPKSNLSSKDAGGHGAGSGLTRKPNKEILEHDRKRQMELRLVVLEDKLADQGYTDAEIAEKVAEARQSLEKEAAVEASREEGEFAPLSVSEKKVSDTQTHQVAARKEKQMEALRAAFGIVPEVQLKKNEVRSISEEKGDEDEISDDGSDKDLNDGAKLHKKAPKNKNSDATKAVKVDKTESARDASELRGHKEQYKELGELTDSSDSEIHEKLKKKIPEQLQKYHGRSASDNDSDEKSKKSLRENRKGKRHAVDYSDSDSDDEKYVKRTRKAHDRRSRHHDTDELESDGEKYERISERHDKRGKKHANDVSKSEEEKNKKHVKSYVKMGEDDTKGEKYRERHGNRSRGHAREDSLSDHEYYERTSERGDKKSRRHDTGDFGYDKEKHEETSKRVDKEGQRRDDSKYNNVKYGKVLEAEKVSPTDRWNNKHDKDNKKYEGGNNFDIDETKKFTKGNGNTRRDRRHDTDDEDDVNKNIEKSRKSRKHDNDDDQSGNRKISSEESDSSADPKDYRRKKREVEKGRRLGGERSEQGRNEGKANVSSGTVERSKGKRVDDKEDTFRKLEDLSRSKRDATEDKSRVIMQGKRKYEDGSQDEQPEAKSRSRTTRTEVNDNHHKGFEENNRSFRNQDVSDQKRDDSLGAKKSEDKQVGKTNGGEELRKEINRRERGERDDRESQRSDYNREERDHRERRRNDVDRKEERRYSRNDDEDSEIVRHRKDEEDSSRKNEKNEVVGQQGTSKRRGREEEEERTRGRDEKNGHVDSSKRGKYDDYHSEKRKYDDDKPDDRGNIRARRRG